MQARSGRSRTPSTRILKPYRFLADVLRRWAGTCAGQVGDGHLADHGAVPVAVLGRGEVAPEQGAEGVLVGDAEEAERTDHHVHVDGIGRRDEVPAGASGVEDAGDQVGDRRAEVHQGLGAAEVFGAMDVLDADQLYEV